MKKVTHFILKQNHYRNPIQGLSVEQGIPRLPNSQKIPQEDSSISRIDGM